MPKDAQGDALAPTVDDPASGSVMPRQRADSDQARLEIDMSRVEGGCLCGAVRYAIEAEPVVTALCHCKHCQRQSGSAFSTLVALPKGSVRYAGGPLAQYRDMGDTGLPMLRKFCPACGSAIVSEPAATPTLEWIKAGTLDDTSWLHPTISIWCEHAQPWVTMDDAMQRLARNPPFGA